MKIAKVFSHLWAKHYCFCIALYNWFWFLHFPLKRKYVWIEKTNYILTWNWCFYVMKPQNSKFGFQIVTIPSGRINWSSWQSRYKNNRKNIDNENKTLSNREKSFVAQFNRVEVFKYCFECSKTNRIEFDFSVNHSQMNLSFERDVIFFNKFLLHFIKLATFNSIYNIANGIYN